ncbi:hypothetical protein [Brevundimonas sp.]|uniref:hypothetical protein n=1 Tax=Brevundimonas sp. TaxID=1871086 RepID=UPI002D6C67E7|nr:hypothetical protein [Brevundimonas sp.]HYD28896.1 hypothetical protein [Brevundimonas sp.]
MTNPFLPQQPQQQPAQQPQQQPNPYQQQPAAPAAPANPYAPATPQQYTQQPAQYGAPAAQQYAPPAANVPVAQPGQFLAPPPPSASGSGNMPKIGDLQGRLLIVMPESLQRGLPSKFQGQGGGAQFVDRMTCKVIVLDGGPLSWGGTTPGSQRQTVNTPYVVNGLWIQQVKLIEQLEEALRVRQSGGPGLSLGRLWKTGPSNNDPYVLAAPQPQEVEQYNAYVSQQNPFAA